MCLNIDTPRHRMAKGGGVVLDHLSVLKIAPHLETRIKTDKGGGAALDHAPPLPLYPVNIQPPRKK